MTDLSKELALAAKSKDEKITEEGQVRDQESLMVKMPEEDQYRLLLEEKTNLERELKGKEEKLRKLKMAELYRKKDDLSNLDDLIVKWKHASQEIIIDLQNALPEPMPSMAALLESFQIDPNLIGYNEVEECFS